MRIEHGVSPTVGASHPTVIQCTLSWWRYDVVMVWIFGILLLWWYDVFGVMSIRRYVVMRDGGMTWV